MGTEVHIIGVPGSGKTSFLIRYIQRLLSRGASKDDIFVVTFTVAAAREVVRHAALPASRVGTLHSVAYRAAGIRREEIALAHLDDWNARYPMWFMAGSDDPDRWEKGDVLLAEVARLRGQEVPKIHWPPYVQAFSRAWEGWKREHDLVDFVDLVEYAPIENFPRAVWLIVDEAQDLTRLELRVIRQWAKEALLILAGDPNQSVYSWRGAGGAFDVAPKELIRLSWSYRLPRRIADYAMRMQVRPTPIETARDGGELGSLPWNVQGFRAALERAGSGSLMLLATARRLLSPAIMWAIDEGIPIANPYAPDVKHWNPLKGWCKTFRAWKEERLTYGDVVTLVGLLRGKVAPGRGVLGKFIEEKKLAHRRVDFGELAAYLAPEVVEHIRRFNISGLLKHVEPNKETTYPLRALLRCGVERVCNPKVVVGTIHSVKGGEADVSLVNLALSQTGKYVELKDPEAVRRMYYVAVTRSRRALFYSAQGGPMGGDYYKLWRGV